MAWFKDDSVTASDHIPREDFNKWLLIFKGYGGRFTSEPVIGVKYISVTYEFAIASDYGRFIDAYRMATATYVEVTPSRLKRFKQWIKKLI